MPGETSLSRSLYARKCAQGCGRKRGSRCGAKRRRSESNRRIEVLQTSALPLGYGAGGRVRSQLTTSSARVGVQTVSTESHVVAIMVAVPWAHYHRVASLVEAIVRTLRACAHGRRSPWLPPLVRTPNRPSRATAGAGRWSAR